MILLKSNPKSEARNPKQIQMIKIQMTKKAFSFNGLLSNSSPLKIDGLVKSRHSGENRSPVFYNGSKILDPGLHRDDSKNRFSTFYGTIKIRI